MSRQCGCLLLGALLLGCGSSSSGAASDAGTDPGPDGPVSGLFNGERVNFTSDGFSLYTKAQDRTTIGGQITGAMNGDMKVTILVPGNTPGHFTCDPSSVAVAISFDQSNATYTTSGQPGTECTVTIDQYGAVGGNVTGSFSGTLAATMRAGNPPPPGEVTITNGTFTVVRQPDQ